MAWVSAFNYASRNIQLGYVGSGEAYPHPKYAYLEREMGPKSKSTLTVRLLKQQRDDLLRELRAIAPELVEKLEETLQALQEQKAERGEYEGLDRPSVIRKYLLKVGRPSELREIRDAVAAPVSRFDARSIWDGGKREVEHGRLLNVANGEKGEAWVLALPEWKEDRKQPDVKQRATPLRGGRRRVLLSITNDQ
jgi:hypothetical protein